MKTLALGLLVALPCFSSAGVFEDLNRAQNGKVDEINASIPVPAVGIARTYKAEPYRLYDASTPFLYAPDKPFNDDEYTYAGCMADESKAQAELNRITTGLKEAKFPLLQSEVNKSTECIDYTLRYTTNLDLIEFTYHGWLPDKETAKTEMQTALSKLKKAGIPLILQASVNENKDGIDYTVAFLANAELKKHEYIGFLPTPAEAGKEMAKTLASLDAASLPVLQATIRTTKEGSDYLIWYAVPAAFDVPSYTYSDPTSAAPGPAVQTGCQVKDQSGTIDSWACRNSTGHWLCYADAIINGGNSRISGGCYESLSDCWSTGAGAVDPCR